MKGKQALGTKKSIKVSVHVSTRKKCSSVRVPVHVMKSELVMNVCCGEVVGLLFA